MTKLFMGCFFVLFLSNIFTYLMGITANYFSPNGLIGLVVSIIVIVGALAILPFINAGAYVIRWIIGATILVALLFSINTHGAVGINIGFGLCSNMMALFPSNPVNTAFIGYLFYLIIGILALVDGLFTVNTGD